MSKVPAQFANDQDPEWSFAEHKRALAAAYAGAVSRLEELKAMEAATPKVLAEAEATVEAAKKALNEVEGKKRRPAKAKEKR